MKKYLLLGTSLIVASSAYAEFDCTKIPTCADLGFTMSATDCAGKNMLKCPFETDKVFCGGESSGGSTGQGCDTVGDILYSDLNCYDPLDKIASGVEPIAVVFDTENRLAIGLKDVGPMYWMKPGLCGLHGQECNIEGITEFDVWNNAVAYSKAWNRWIGEVIEYVYPNDNGKNNTKAVIDLGGDYASSDYAPGYCYYSTEGGQKEGSWFLPSATETKKLIENYVDVYNALTDVGEVFLGCTSTGNNTSHCEYYYTSSEVGTSSFVTIQYTCNPNTSSQLGMMRPAVRTSYSSEGKTNSPTYYVRCAIQY